MVAAILGYGKSGKSAERFLKYKGIEDIKIFDDNLSVYPNLKEFKNMYDIVVASPGIKLDDEILNAENLTSEVELVANEIDNKNIICVTGTNGKSTVTYLTAQILNNFGIKASYCGNIGKTITDAYLDEKPEIYVLELSSFQIELLKKFKTHIACVTNIAPDHLDRYSNYEEYVRAKFKIINHIEDKGFLIINKNNEFENLIENNSLNKINIDETFKEFPLFENNILNFGKFYVDTNKFKLFGRHNIVNLAFSLMLSDRFCDLQGDVTDLIKNLKGLEHRCEFVENIKGVTYINDSKGTNVYSTLVALKGIDKNAILILGGKDKEGKFDILVSEINKKSKQIILFGAASEKIHEQLKGKIKVPVKKLKTLNEVLDYVFKISTAEDVVLFSPACSSFDQFKNFEERGRFFKKLVASLKESA